MKKLMTFIAMTLTLLLCGCSQTKQIDLLENIEIIYQGGQGYGIAKIKDSNAYVGSYDDGKITLNVGEVEYDIKPYSSLSNGDTITVYASVNTNKLDGYDVVATKDYKVEDLQELTPINVFDYIQINYEGIDSLGRILSIDDQLPQEIANVKLAYNANVDQYLSNGDTVTVSVSYSDRTLEDSGYCLEKISQDFVVEGLVKGFGLNALSSDYLDKIESYEREYTQDLDTLSNYQSVMIDVCNNEDLDNLIDGYLEYDDNVTYHITNIALANQALISNDEYNKYQLIDIYSIEVDDPLLGVTTIYIGFGYDNISDTYGSEDNYEIVTYNNKNVFASLSYEKTYNTMVEGYHLVDLANY